MFPRGAVVSCAGTELVMGLMRARQRRRDLPPLRNQLKCMVSALRPHVLGGGPPRPPARGIIRVRVMIHLARARVRGIKRPRNPF